MWKDAKMWIWKIWKNMLWRQQQLSERSEPSLQMERETPSISKLAPTFDRTKVLKMQTPNSHPKFWDKLCHADCIRPWYERIWRSAKGWLNDCKEFSGNPWWAALGHETSYIGKNGFESNLFYDMAAKNAACVPGWALAHTVTQCNSITWRQAFNFIREKVQHTKADMMLGMSTIYNCKPFGMLGHKGSTIEACWKGPFADSLLCFANHQEEINLSEGCDQILHGGPPMIPLSKHRENSISRIYMREKQNISIFISVLYEM